MDIGTRLDAGCDFTGHFGKDTRIPLLANELLFEFPLPPGLVADPRQGDPGIGNLLIIRNQEHRHTDDGKIAKPPGELGKRPSRPGGHLGNSRLEHDFIAGKRGGQIRLEEIPCRDFALGGQAGNRERAIQCKHYCRQLGCRIGVGKAAAQGPSIARLRVTNVGQSIGQ